MKENSWAKWQSSLVTRFYRAEILFSFFFFGFKSGKTRGDREAETS